MTIPKKLSYFEKLKDPRWQKLRLEAMEKRGWECENCGAKDKTLNVHHRRYIRGRDPWEYSLDQLQVFCEKCHADHHAQDDRLSEILSLPYTTIGTIIGFAAALAENVMCDEFPAKFRPRDGEELDGYILGMLRVPGHLANKLLDSAIKDGLDPDITQGEYLHSMKHWDAPMLGPVVPKPPTEP